MQCGTFVGKQTVKIRFMRKIHFPGINDLRFSRVNLQGTQLAVAAQAFVKQRLLFLDEPGFEQKRAQFTCRLDPGDPPGLSEHRRFVRRTQVRHHPTADIYAFADIERHGVAVAVEEIDARLFRQRLKPGAKMLGIFVDSRRFKLKTRGGLTPAHILLHILFRHTV